MHAAKALKEELYRQLSRIGKCLSSDKRLEILTLLSQGSKSVEKLAACTEMSVANVSRHLQILLEAKLVKFAKHKTYAIYALADPAIAGFLSSLWQVSVHQLPDIEKLKDDFMTDLSDVQTLSMDEVMERLKSDSILLLDVRPTEEYESGHIAGAISVPIDSLERLMHELSRASEYVAYCSGPLCVSSALAAHQLCSQGFKAYQMDEGLNEWQEHFR